MKKKPKEFNLDAATYSRYFALGPGGIYFKRGDESQWDDKRWERVKAYLTTLTPPGGWKRQEAEVRGRVEEVIVVPYSFLDEKEPLKPKRLVEPSQIFGKEPDRSVPNDNQK